MWLVAAYHVSRMVANTKKLPSLLIPKTHQTPFPSLSRDDTGVLERTQERIHQEEWKERTQEVSTHGRESMLIYYLLIAEGRPEPLPLLSPLSLGMSTGVQKHAAEDYAGG